MEDKMANNSIVKAEDEILNYNETLLVAKEKDKKMNDFFITDLKNNSDIFDFIHQMEELNVFFPKGFYDTLEEMPEKELFERNNFRKEVLVQLQAYNKESSIPQHVSEELLYFFYIWQLLCSDDSSLLEKQQEYNHTFCDFKNNTTPNSLNKLMGYGDDLSTELNNWFDNEFLKFHSLMYQIKDIGFNKIPGIISESTKLDYSQQNDQSDKVCQLFQSYCKYCLMWLQICDELESLGNEIFNTYEYDKNIFLALASELYLNQNSLKCQMIEDFMYKVDYLRDGLIEANKFIRNPSLNKDDINELKVNYINTIFNSDIFNMSLTKKLERDINCNPKNFYGGFFIEKPSNDKLKNAYDNAFQSTVQAIEKLYNELWRLGYLKKSVNVMHSFVYRLTQYLPYGIEIEPTKITWGNGDSGDVYALLHFAKNAFGINKGYKKDYFERCKKIFEFDTTKNPDLKFPDIMNYRSIQHRVSPELTRIANEFSTSINKIHEDYNKKVEKCNKKGK